MSLQRSIRKIIEICTSRSFIYNQIQISRGADKGLGVGIKEGGS